MDYKRIAHDMGAEPEDVKEVMLFLDKHDPPDLMGSLQRQFPQLNEAQLQAIYQLWLERPQTGVA